MKKTVLLLIIIALVSCKKESIPVPQPVVQSIPSIPMIGSWVEDSSYYRNNIHHHDSMMFFELEDTIIFKVLGLAPCIGIPDPTMKQLSFTYCSVSGGYLNISTTTGWSQGGVWVINSWQYIITTNNLILKSDSETNYYHKY